MRASLKSLALLSMIAVFGCGGGARLDASSKEKLEDSMKAMRAGMTDVQKREFAQDLATAVGQGAMMSGFAAGGEKGKEAAASNPADAYKPLNGMTAEEIHDKAVERRQKAGTKAK